MKVPTGRFSSTPNLANRPGFAWADADWSEADAAVERLAACAIAYGKTKGTDLESLAKDALLTAAEVYYLTVKTTREKIDVERSK